MKLSLFKTLLFLSCLAVIGFTSAEEEEVDVCAEQSEALDADETVVAAMEAMANATAGIFIAPSQGSEVLLDGSVEDEIDLYTPNCVGTDDNATLWCQFDYSEYSSAVESACVSAGGQFYTGDARIVCESRDLRSELHYLSSPICVGVDCEEPGDLFEAAWEGLAEDDITVAGEVSCLAFFDSVDRPFPSAACSTTFSLVALLIVVALAAVVRL
jgi:hypothetical protein